MSSLPASSLEEDLSHTCPSSKDGEPASHDVPPPSSRPSTDKGKLKQVEEDLCDDDDDDDPIETTYPPTTDEAAETRRVEENLRRWEMAERERRRAARESAQAASRGSGPSLLGAVTRRASVLLSNRQGGRTSPGGLGNHRALNSRDSSDAVPLNDVDRSPRASENPFIHQSERGPAFVTPPQSPFGDSNEPSVVVHSPGVFGSETPSPQPTIFPRRPPTLVPPPRPLGLPRPLSPPPEVANPHTTPMKATPAPTLRPGPAEPEREVRWWHEWLCGCSEGPDRGGDFQAGRTNPFE